MPKHRSPKGGTYRNPGRHGAQYVYAGVTSVTKWADEGGWRIPWAAKLTAERAVEQLPLWTEMATDADKIGYLKGAPWSSRDAGAAKGTAAHDYVEAVLRGEAPEPASGWQRAARRFIEDSRPEPALVEVTIYNEDHLFAGTADFVGRFKRMDMYGRVIVDWKTSKDLHLDQLVQVVGAYGLGAQYYLDDSDHEQEWQPPEGALIVLFGEDGSYRIEASPMDVRYRRAFLACLELARLNEAGPQTMPVTIDDNWDEVWLRQWLDKNPDRQLEIADSCRQAGIEIRRHLRTSADTEAIIQIIKLLEMSEP
jgi:hypothetical protein